MEVFDSLPFGDDAAETQIAPDLCNAAVDRFYHEQPPSPDSDDCSEDVAIWQHPSCPSLSSLNLYMFCHPIRVKNGFGFSNVFEVLSLVWKAPQDGWFNTEVSRRPLKTPQVKCILHPVLQSQGDAPQAVPTEARRWR